MGVSLDTWRVAIGLFIQGRWKFGSSRKHAATGDSLTLLPVLAVVMVLLIIGNIEMNPGPPCKFKSCRVSTETIASNVRHQQYHSSNSNFNYYCPSPDCVYITKSFNALNFHVSTFHRDTRHDIIDASEPNKLLCSVKECPYASDSLWKLVQHTLQHLNSGDPLEGVQCPIKPCRLGNNLHKSSTFRVHLSQYHPGWKDEGCPPPKKRRKIDETESSSTTQSFEVEGSFEFEEDTVCADNNEDTEDWELLNDELIVDKIAKFYLQLYGEFFIAYSTIQDISVAISFISGLNNLRVKKILKAELTALGVIPIQVNEMCHKIGTADILFSTHHKNAPGPSLTTDYLRKEYFKKNYNYIDPQEIDLGKDSNPDHKLQYVSIDQTLSTIFEDPVVQKDIEESFSRHPSNTDEISDYTEGSLFKKENHEPKEIHLHMYQDSYNPVMNALGSAKNKYKSLAVYFTLGNLKSSNRSKIDSKHLVLMVRESVFKELGAKVCFEELVKELKILEETGTLYKGERNKVRVQFLLGDNLGQHMVGGFLESFTCQYFCHYCDIQRADFKENPDKTNPSRTKEDYAQCVMEAKLTKESCRGIKQDCVLNGLKNFHAVSHLPPCIAHDLFEGVVSWDLSGIIRCFVRKKWFTYKLLNKRIKKFKCNGIDGPNKPAFVKSKGKGKKDSKVLGGHAVQNWSLLRLLPFIIGDKIKDFNDPAWKLYVMLKQICEYYCGQSFLKTDAPYIRDVLIPLYFEQRTQVLDESKHPRKPKHHFSVHMAQKMLEMGPLLHLWTMPYEQKHKLFKTVCRQSRNFINVEYTCATRHQLNLAYRATGPLFPEGCIQIGPSALCFDSYQGDLKNYLKTLSFAKQNCRTCKAVNLDGILYSSGDLLLLSSNRSDIDCGWIKLILCTESDVIFILECITAKLNNKVGIYEVPQDASGELNWVHARGLKYAQPQPLYNFKEKLCFSVKGKVI